MSCLDGVQLAGYAAGELTPSERRAAEAHLVRCRDCRAQVLALREAEARAAAEGAPREPQPAGGEAGFALGFALALAVVALVIAGLGRVGGGLAAGSALFGTSGAYGMLFDFVFWVRSRAPGLLELVVALAATASVAAIAALGVASLARRVGPRLVVALAVGAAASLPAPGRAFELRADADARVAVGEVVEGSLAASGDEVRVEGRVEGDLFVAGETVVIAGVVDGNVFAWARDLEVNGRIGGSLHAVTKRLAIDGEIGGSSYGLHETLRAGESARVAFDAQVVARSVDWQGAVGRDIHLWSDRVALDGAVGRDFLVARAEQVRIGDRASVGRNLRVGVAREADLEVAAGARIGGARETALREDAHPALWEAEPWLWLLVRVAAALAFGVALYALLPGLFWARVPTLGSFGRLLGVGFLALLGVPLALALVALTLVGLPLAVVGAFAFLTALYLAHVLAAAELGRALLRRSAQDLPSLASFARVLLVGLCAVAVVSQLPVLGPAVRVVMLLVGLGLVAERVRAFTRSPGRASHGTFRAGQAS
jgi:hypothetical protein